MPKTLEKGVLITFEGGEGAGKSTQSRLLHDYLRQKDYDVELSREPGGTPTSEAIRGIIKNSSLPKTLLTELFLFEAARAEYVSSTIKPALARGKVMISDRFSDSTIVYQGIAGGLPLEIIGQMNGIATDNLTPDLTFIIDVPVEVGLEKTVSTTSPDFMDKKGLPFYTKVNRAFRTLALSYGEYPHGRMVLVEYIPNDIEGMQLRIRSIAEEFLVRKK